MHIDPATLSPGRRYFLLISCVIPRPIAWISTVNEDGGYNLGPFSFFNAYSATPPIVGIGFSPHEDKGQKDTLRNAQRSGELCINLGDMPLVAQLDACGDDLPYGVSEFTHAGLTPAACELIAAPRVAEAPISFECGVYQIIPLGDQGSTLLLAEVKLLHLRDTLIDYRGCVDPARFRCIARMGGGRYAPVGDVFKAREQAPVG